MAKTITCNMCGKVFDEFDKQEEHGIHKWLGFGSKYDGDELDLDICCKCLDSLIDQCEITPLIPNEGY